VATRISKNDPLLGLKILKTCGNSEETRNFQTMRLPSVVWRVSPVFPKKTYLNTGPPNSTPSSIQNKGTHLIDPLVSL